MTLRSARPPHDPGAHRPHEAPQRQLGRVFEDRIGSCPGKQAHGFGRQDASDRRRTGESLGLGDRRAEVVLALPGDVARGEADTKLQRERAAASLAVDRALHLHGAGERGAGRLEGGQEAVAERLDPHGAMSREGIAQAAVVLEAQGVRRLGTQPRPHPR